MPTLQSESCYLISGLMGGFESLLTIRYWKQLCSSPCRLTGLSDGQRTLSSAAPSGLAFATPGPQEQTPTPPFVPVNAPISGDVRLRQQLLLSSVSQQRTRGFSLLEGLIVLSLLITTSCYCRPTKCQQGKNWLRFLFMSKIILEG